MIKLSQIHKDALGGIQQLNIDIMLAHNALSRIEDQLTSQEIAALERIVEYVDIDADDLLERWYQEIQGQEAEDGPAQDV